MKNIIFIAPPATGKGTLSGKLKDKYGYAHLSTGDLLRAEVASGSELGKELKAVMDSGALVGDDLITKLLKSELSKYVEDKNFILDGYPRNIEQAETLSEIFNELNIEDNYVSIYLNIDKEEAMHRALGRITCDKCKTIYNLYTEGMIPESAGICDNCGAELMQRDDDNEETFIKRFDTYVEHTSPVVEYYRSNNKLETVEVAATPEESLARVEAVLNK